MKRILLLTWRYLAFNKIKTTILIACLTIVVFLPMAVQALLSYYEKDLYARAEATPLVYGARGDRFDLVLKSLYFKGDSPGGISVADWDKLREEMAKDEMGSAIPLHVEFTGGGMPIVGTTLDYLEFRGLEVAEGSAPLVLGDAVLGAEAARELGIGVGGSVLTDQTSLYNQASVYRVKLNITGVLEPSGTVDDLGVFCDLKTAWIIEGIGHGHTEVTDANRKQLMIQGPDGDLIVKPSVTSYTEITRENMDSFHFHAPRSELPLTSILVLPANHEFGVRIKARYGVSESKQILRPVTVVRELMGIVLQVKRFFDANFALVALAVVLFLILVVMLSLKIRERERVTLYRIGCARGTVAAVQLMELLIVFAVSVLLALLLAWATVQVVPGMLM